MYVHMYKCVSATLRTVPTDSRRSSTNQYTKSSVLDPLSGQEEGFISIAN